MTNKQPLSSALYDLIKQYELMSNTEEKNQYLLNAYEFILDSLQKNDNDSLEKALTQADYLNDDVLYSTANSLILTTIHRQTYTEDDKEYCSHLFVVPCFTINQTQNSHDMHYPPISELETIFKKHFLNQGLINDTSQLHLPSFKINDDIAYNMSFSDWYNLHKDSYLKKINATRDEYYNKDLSLPIPDEGELGFFPLLITYEINDLVEEPTICDMENYDLPFETAIEGIEKDIALLSGTGTWAIGVPSYFEHALDFGLEIKQDFNLDYLLKNFMQREDIDIIIFPITEADLALIAWNNETEEIQASLELNCYSADDQELVDYLLQQIAFYDINKTYLFEEHIGIHSLEHLETINLDDISEKHQVIVLEKDNSTNPTLH